MIEQILQRIGLTKNEIKVYEALLSLGESKTGEILTKSGLNSGKIYEIMDSLQKKGLVSSIVKNNVKYFTPANPRRVFDYIEDKKKDLDSQEEEFKKIIPQIISKISSASPKTKIEIFTGFNGFKTAFLKELDYYKKGVQAYIFGVLSYTKYEKKINDFFVNNLMPKREISGVRAKRLFDENSRKENFFAQKGSQTRYLPYQSPVGFNVISNLTTIGIFTEEPIIISIESEEVAKSFIEQFELLWKIAKH